MRSKFFIDTCSLVAIHYSGFYNEINEFLDLFVTDTVISELKKMAKYDDEDGLCATKILEKKHMLNIIPSELCGDAEEELMILSKEHSSIFITDDIKAMKKAPKNLRVLNSVHLIYILFRKNIIDKNSAIEAFNKMRNNRDWKKNSLVSIGKKLLIEN
jgi:rRNA-processing protein FCF1